MDSIAALGLGLGVAWLAGCDSPQADGSTAQAGAAAVLSPCNLPRYGRQGQCGAVSVPLDRARPAGERIDLNVVVLPRRRQDAEGTPIVLLAGGPGQAATDAYRGLVPRWSKLADARDIVLIDQRGTGSSAPFDCVAHTDRLTALTEPGAMGELAASCVRDGLRHDPAYFGTRDAIDDVLEVMDALGHERFGVLGISYGTRAALVLMQRAPTRVTSAVLDSVAPIEMPLPLTFAEDGQRALDRLLSSCEDAEECAAAFPDLRQEFHAMLERLRLEPITLTLPHPRTHAPTELRLDAQSVVHQLRGALYSADAASLVPLAIARASRGSWDTLVGLVLTFAEGMEDGLDMGMFLSVVCAEDQPRWDGAPKVATDNVLGTRMFEDVRDACLRWPVTPLPRHQLSPPQAPLEVPTLLLSGAEDPVTPPRWAETAMQHLANARHVVLEGTGHGASATGCGGDLAVSFLLGEPLDQLDVTCAAEQPRPAPFLDLAGPAF